MTLVDATTGEIVEILTESQARDLTDRIKAELSATWDLITEAYQRRAWDALGFDTWDSYCKAEFGTSRIKLPSEERREVVSSLRDAGLSIRAIASATDTSVGTVHKDLSSPGVQNRTPERRPLDRPEVEPNFGTKVKGTDGKTYKPTKTTTTERTTQTRQTVTEPTPSAPDDDAEAINRGFANAVDPSADYRKRFTDALTRAHDLTQFNAERAIATGGESTGLNRHLVKSLADWCDAYLKATRPTHLRSAQ